MIYIYTRTLQNNISNVKFILTPGFLITGVISSLIQLRQVKELLATVHSIQIFWGEEDKMAFKATEVGHRIAMSLEPEQRRRTSSRLPIISH